MLKRRDIPPVLLLLLLIILVMLTLSQILVVHNGRYGRNVHNMRKLQLELREMDINLHSLMLQNVPSIELNRRLLQNHINAARIAAIIRDAAAQAPIMTAQPRRERGRGRGRPNSHRTNMTHPTHNLIHPPLTNKSETLTPLSHTPTTQTQTLIHRPTPQKHNLTHNLTHHTPFTQPLPTPSFTKTNSTLESSNPIPDNNTGNMALSPSYGVDYNHPDLLTAYHMLHPEQGNTPIKYCPSIPPSLEGSVDVHVDISKAPSVEQVMQENPSLEPGGCWKPSNCTARHKVAVIIPYRDREEHLLILLRNLHPMLQKQQLDYRLVVVEQFGADTFNKARIMNIAFVEILKRHNFHCFVFHDVDLVPEDDRNMYSCPSQPRHMSVAIDEMGYKLAYQELVGGVLNMRTEHFQRVNGYSNLYWGWGAEDDDMAYRIMHVGLKITRPPESVARYKMVKHTKRKPADWRKRAKLLYTGTRRFQFDGLNSLQYKLLHVEYRPLFTHILVDIGKPPRGF